MQNFERASNPPATINPQSLRSLHESSCRAALPEGNQSGYGKGWRLDKAETNANRLFSRSFQTRSITYLSNPFCLARENPVIARNI
jgi:hypothetical protein